MQNRYPVEILPNNTFVLHMNIGELIRCYPNLCVVRRINGKKDDAFEKFNGEHRLKEHYLGQVLNLSLNLIGGKFKVDLHLGFSPNGSAVHNWDGQDINLDDIQNNYKMEESCFPIYFKAKEIFNFPFEYSRCFKDKKNYLMFCKATNVSDIEGKYITVFGKGQLINQTVRTHAILRHEPTNFNYWHCVLDSFPYNSSTKPVETDENTKPIKRLRRKLRTELITHYASENAIIDYHIRPCHYKKHC
jgi:hypothetical protein